MIQITLSLILIAFGFFLKYTKNPGFQRSRRFSGFFIILGIITLIGKIALIYYESKA